MDLAISWSKHTFK